MYVKNTVYIQTRALFWTPFLISKPKRVLLPLLEDTYYKLVTDGYGNMGATIFEFLKIRTHELKNALEI